MLHQHWLVRQRRSSENEQHAMLRLEGTWLVVGYVFTPCIQMQSSAWHAEADHYVQACEASMTNLTTTLVLSIPQLVCQDPHFCSEHGQLSLQHHLLSDSDREAP